MNYYIAVVNEAKFYQFLPPHFLRSVETIHPYISVPEYPWRKNEPPSWPFSWNSPESDPTEVYPCELEWVANSSPYSKRRHPLADTGRPERTVPTSNNGPCRLISPSSHLVNTSSAVGCRSCCAAISPTRRCIACLSANCKLSRWTHSNRLLNSYVIFIYCIKCKQ